MDDINKIKLLLNYNLNLTKDENVKILKKTIIEQSNDYNITVTDNPPTEHTSEFDIKKYPNYCSYPERAFLPPEVAPGIKGEDALKQGYCYYAQPQEKGVKGISGIYLPVDAIISFVDVRFISNNVDRFMEKHPNTGPRELLIQNFTRIFPLNSVSNFIIDGQQYNPWVELTPNNDWMFIGYYRKDGETKYKYESKWEDVRTPYQKFVDKYGLLVQLTAALGTAIATVISGGAASMLYLEILIEAGLSIPVGLRELEKGENVSAAISFITGALPMLKLSKSFRGINETTLKELSKSFIDSTLTKSSSIDEFVEFYNKLPEQQKVVFDKIFKQDDYTKNELKAMIKTSFESESEVLSILKESGKLKELPALLGKISFRQRLWARELGANMFFIVLGLIANNVWGKTLNADNLEELKGVFLKIGDVKFKDEISDNLITNAQIIDELVNTPSFKEFKKMVDLGKTSKSWTKALNTKIKDAFNEAGRPYNELSEDVNKPAIDEEGSKKLEKELIKKGYKKFIDLTQEEQKKEWLDYRKINNDSWVLINN